MDVSTAVNELLFELLFSNLALGPLQWGDEGRCVCQLDPVVVTLYVVWCIYHLYRPMGHGGNTVCSLRHS